MEEQGITYTNRSGVRQTRVLGPAIYRRSGPDSTFAYEDLRSTAIVRISPDQIDDRPAPRGGLPGAMFADRARRYWSLGAAHARSDRIERLVAVMTGQPIVLGSWRLTEPFVAPVNGGWEFVLADSEQDDDADLKGRLLTFMNRYAFQNLGYSRDLRAGRESE